MRKYSRRIVAPVVEAVAVYEGGGDGRVATYCQDTVLPWQGHAPPDDEAMRAFGRRVTAAVIESATAPAAEREAVVAKSLGAKD